MKKSAITLPKDTLVPNHIVIIPDGNRRWARARNLPPWEGHRKGFDLTPKLAQACREMGVHTLTLWAFSTENWDRPKKEIDFLMKKYEEFVDSHLKSAQKDGARIFHLGRKDRLPKSLIKKLDHAEEATKNNKKFVMNVAIDYGGHDEVLRAVKKMLANGLNPEELDEKVFASYLDTSEQPYPNPDLIIRSSGEQRLSGLLSWQSAYAELYWLDDHFPEFNEEKLKEAVLEFSRRRRRFGGDDNTPKVKFDPAEVAELEVSWWKESHNPNGKFTSFLTKWIKELYGLPEKEAKQIVPLLEKGIILHHKRDWEKSTKEMVSFYEKVKEKSNFVFNPEVVAKLEINWWKIHDDLEKIFDKAKLEKALADLYGEIYRLSRFQTTKVAHLRAMAASLHDQAETQGSNGESKKFWDETQEYLTKSYQALKEVAS